MLRWERGTVKSALGSWPGVDRVEVELEDGTGTAAAIDGVEVGGKTGTAEWGEDRAPHSWFVGYGQTDEQKIAVAVVVEEGGYGSRTAAPIARDVMEAVIQR